MRHLRTAMRNLHMATAHRRRMGIIIRRHMDIRHRLMGTGVMHHHRTVIHHMDMEHRQGRHHLTDMAIPHLQAHRQLVITAP